MRNRTSDLRIPRSDALPLSHRDSTVSEVYYEVHLTRVLHTASISNVDSVMFVDRNKRDVKFWARKINRERCFSSCHERESVRHRSIDSTWSIEARNPKFWGSVPQRTQNFFFVSRSWQNEKLFSLHHEYFHEVWRCPILQKVNKTFSAEKHKNEQGMIYNRCDKFPMSLTKMELAKLPHPNLF